MDGILPIILALVAMIASAALKKKAKPTEHPTAESSPWDDLLQELEHLGKEKSEGDFSSESSAESVEPMEPQSMEVILESQPPFSYDDEVLSEQVAPYSYESTSPELPTLPDTPVVPVHPVVAQAVPEQPQDTDAAPSVFGQGFDPKLGLLYAEIMRPKFQDY